MVDPRSSRHAWHCDSTLDRRLAHVLSCLSASPRNELALEQALLEELGGVLDQDGKHARWVQRPAALQAATRTELARRLRRAVDYMVAFGTEPITLEELSRAACLSKYHFLRSFRAFTGWRRPWPRASPVTCARSSCSAQ